MKNFFAKHRSGSTLGALLCISFIMIIISTQSINFRPKQVGLSIFSTLQVAVSRTARFFSDTVNSISELRKLKSEYEEVRRRLEDYENRERDFVAIRQENDRLTELLGFQKQVKYSHVAAEVIAKDPGNLFSTLIINKGAHNGIRKDMPVVAFQDGFQGLVGKIVEVGLFSSVMMPIFDTSSYIGGRIQGSRYDGLVNGSGKGVEHIYMKYVEKRAREDIQYGDLVVTSGMRSLYPRDIYIGRVRAIGAKEWETYLELEIEPIIDFSRLEYVFVLDGGEK
ncbi:MAG: rod shape-determining protein MreC [Spirochaetales bacterium]|nr:rod shape-determining protein MreC [Spirochaetales bacterium]